MKPFYPALVAALALVGLTACNHEVRAPARSTAPSGAARAMAPAGNGNSNSDSSADSSTRTESGTSTTNSDAPLASDSTEAASPPPTGNKPSGVEPTTASLLPVSPKRDAFYAELVKLKGLWKASGMDVLSGETLDPIDPKDASKPYDLSPDVAAVRANLDLRAARASAKILPAASLTVDGISNWARTGLAEDFARLNPEFDQLDIALNRIPNGEIDESVRRVEAARIAGLKGFFKDTRMVSAIADWKVTSMSVVAGNGDAAKTGTASPNSRTDAETKAAADKKLTDELNAAEGTKNKSAVPVGSTASSTAGSTAGTSAKKTSAQLEADRKAAELKAAELKAAELKAADQKTVSSPSTAKKAAAQPASPKTSTRTAGEAASKKSTTATAKSAAEKIALENQSAKKAAEKSKMDAATSKKAAAKTESDAETAKKAAEKTRLDADAAKKTAAKTKLEAETAKKAAEKTALDAETAEKSAARAKLDREKAAAAKRALDSDEANARKSAGTDAKRISRKQFDGALAEVKRSFDDAKIGDLFNRTMKLKVERETLEPIAKEDLAAYASVPKLYTLAPKEVEARLDANYPAVLKNKRSTDDEASLAERTRADLRADLAEISSGAENLRKRLENVVVTDFPEDVALVAESKRLHALVRMLRSEDLETAISNWKKSAGATSSGSPEKGTSTSKKNGTADAWAAAPIGYRFGDVKTSCFGADAKGDTFILLPNADGKNPKCAGQFRVTLNLAAANSKKLPGDDTKICLGTIPHVGEKSHYAICALANLKAKSCAEAEIESCKQDAATIVVTTAPISTARTTGTTGNGAGSPSRTGTTVPSAAAALAIDE